MFNQNGKPIFYSLGPNLSPSLRSFLFLLAQPDLALAQLAASAQPLSLTTAAQLPALAQLARAAQEELAP